MDAATQSDEETGNTVTTNVQESKQISNPTINNTVQSEEEKNSQPKQIKKSSGPVNYDEYIKFEKFEKYPVVSDGWLADYDKARTLADLEKYSEFIAIVSPTTAFCEEKDNDKWEIKSGRYTSENYYTIRNYSVIKVIKSDETLGNIKEIKFKEKLYFDKERENGPAILCGSGGFVKKQNSKYIIFCNKNSDGSYYIRSYQGAYCIDGTDWNFITNHNSELYKEILTEYKDIIKDYFPYDKLDEYEYILRTIDPPEEALKEVGEYNTLQELENAADLIVVASTKTHFRNGKQENGATIRDFDVLEVLYGDEKLSKIKIKEYATIQAGIEQKDKEFISAKKDVLICKNDTKYLLFLKKEADGTYTAFRKQGGYCLDGKDITYSRNIDISMYEAVFKDYNNLFVKY